MLYRIQSAIGLLSLIILSFVHTTVLGKNELSAMPLSIEKGLPDKLSPEWSAIGPERKIKSESSPEVFDIKLLNEYGLQSITSREYVNQSSRVQVERFEFKYASGAYGSWTMSGATNPQNQHNLVNGRYLLRFTGSDALIVEQLTANLKNTLVSNAEPPLLPTYLPEPNKIAGSERYIVGPEGIARIPELNSLKDVIDFTGGTHAAVAEYNNGDGKMSVILVEFQSPQFATDGLNKIQQHFDSLSQEEQQKRILRRVGNYGVEAVNVTDPKAAEEILKQIKYMARVYWEGKGLSSIPLKFRPLDPATIREVIQSGQLIVAVFYWIAVLLVGAVGIGIFTGGAFFYWRRAQRRRLGLEDSFSDAGGMTRLNLDDYMLTSSQSPSNLIGKGE